MAAKKYFEQGRFGYLWNRYHKVRNRVTKLKFASMSAHFSENCNSDTFLKIHQHSGKPLLIDNSFSKYIIISWKVGGQRIILSRYTIYLTIVSEIRLQILGKKVPTNTTISLMQFFAHKRITLSSHVSNRNSPTLYRLFPTIRPQTYSWLI